MTVSPLKRAWQGFKMSRIIWVYGLIAGVVIIASILTGIVLDLGTGTASLWFGYLVMLAALSLIFAGVKRYRDGQPGRVIRFTTALGVGVGIALVASAMYVVVWECYLWLTNYTFFDVYTKNAIAAKRASGASADDIAKLTETLTQMGANYSHPLYRMGTTLMEILPVGVAVALLSAGVLRRSRPQPTSA